jgi:hypothetical protein
LACSCATLGTGAQGLQLRLYVSPQCCDWSLKRADSTCCAFPAQAGRHSGLLVPVGLQVGPPTCPCLLCCCALQITSPRCPLCLAGTGCACLTRTPLPESHAAACAGTVTVHECVMEGALRG